MHFHALGGTGFYTLSAKKQGLFPAATQLIVGVHALPASEMVNIDLNLAQSDPVFDKSLLTQDFMQQSSAELAVSQGCV